MRLLFVCGGNTCRSPMAVGVCQGLYPAVQAESAGIAHHDGAANAKAVAALASVFSFPCPAHVPRSLDGLDLAAYDAVVAMKEDIAEGIRRSTAAIGIGFRLVTWDIDDPYGAGAGTYASCAKRIAARTIMLLEGSLDAASSVTLASTVPLCETFAVRLARWIAEIDSGQLRGTTLQGIASSAGKTFESKLREAAKSTPSIASKVKPMVKFVDLIKMLRQAGCVGSIAVDPDVIDLIDHVRLVRNAATHDELPPVDLQPLAREMLVDMSSVVAACLPD